MGMSPSSFVELVLAWGSAARHGEAKQVVAAAPPVVVDIGQTLHGGFVGKLVPKPVKTVTTGALTARLDQGV